MAALHHHHAAEDDLIWPKLHARAPAFAEDITRMEHAHRGIADADAKVRTILAWWVTSADVRLTQQLVEAVEELSARVDVHPADEERNIVPLINQQISPKEWQNASLAGLNSYRGRISGSGSCWAAWSSTLRQLTRHGGCWPLCLYRNVFWWGYSRDHLGAEMNRTVETNLLTIIATLETDQRDCRCAAAGSETCCGKESSDAP
jgi:hypothetical protein